MCGYVRERRSAAQLEELLDRAIREWRDPYQDFGDIGDTFVDLIEALSDQTP